MYGYIYKTTNILTEKIYIGQTCKQGKDFDYYFGSGTILKLSIKKYGIHNFTKEILRICKSQKELDVFEEIYIKRFDSINSKIGYNILSENPVGCGDKNPMKIESVKIKNSILRRGKKASEEAKSNLSKALKGRKLSEEHKNNISKGNKGKIHSEETIMKISNAKKGKKFSAKHKESLSKAMRENPRIFTEEIRNKISKALKGRKIIKN